MSASVENATLSVLLERYPSLFFLLQYTASESISQPVADSLEQIRISIRKSALSECATLYVYGIGTGAHHLALQEWLRADVSKRVIFLEDRLEALRAFLDSPHALPLLLDTQVDVRYISDPKQLDPLLGQLMIDYPCERVEVLAQSGYQGGRFRRLRLELLRKSTLSHALATESLQYHKLLVNVLSNIQRWHGSFFANGLKGKFKNIPAVICGAGPSLQAHLPFLKTLEDRALIIAGGSAITALSNAGVIPHFGLAIDPNPEEFERLKNASAYQMPLLYGTRLYSQVFNALNGERGYLVTNTGGSCEGHFEKALQFPEDPVGQELGMEALSVTTLALGFAAHLGCNPILFSGVDLAFTGMQRYAPGVVSNSSVNAQQLKSAVRTSERHLKRKGIQGHFVSTLVKWVMESDCIAAFAKAHPHIRFINVSDSGLGFKGILNRPFSDVLDEEDFVPFDLGALVHAEIEQLKLPPIKESIQKEMQSLCSSLERLDQMMVQYVNELQRIQAAKGVYPSAKLTLLQFDLEEETASSCLNASVGLTLDQLLSRLYPAQSGNVGENDPSLLIRKQIAKFTKWQEIVREQLALVRSQLDFVH